jgi:hypothetical protein
MAGLVPAIHVFALAGPKDADARHKAGHDASEFLPDVCRLLYWACPVAGSSCTDSPQPQAAVWFGLLNTNWAANLLTL